MALCNSMLAAALFTLTDAIPTVSFPLNSQVPPIARLLKPFSYTFPESTFSSTLPLTYTLESKASWLSLDSNTRTLSGIPFAHDVGPDTVTAFLVSLTASDSTGSATLNATLVVSQNPAPAIYIPLSTQLKTFGEYSAPSTILYHPSTSFQFKFDPSTFSTEGGNSEFNYYAVTDSNTPLPSWILFDGSLLSISGQTPDYHSLIQPPQTFGIKVIASDIEGFAGTSIILYIEVGVHLLAFTEAISTINTIPGANISYGDLASKLRLDSQAPKSSDLVTITALVPDWLNFDNKSLAVTGSVPKNAISFNVSVYAEDIYGDTAEAFIYVNVSARIFSSSIRLINATIGSKISCNLGSYLHNKTDINLTVQIPPHETWLSFESTTFELAGQVPLTESPSTFEIQLYAASKSHNNFASQVVQIALVDGASRLAPSKTSFPPQTTASSTPSSTGTISASSKPQTGLSKRLFLAICIPISVLVAGLLLALCCCWRRRRHAKHPVTPSKSEISAPVEARSSPVGIIRAPRIQPPKPLHLDTSGFSADHNYEKTLSDTRKERRVTKGLSSNPTRRSQTISARSDARRSQLRESDNSGNRARSYSDNALSKTEDSWRSTQDSAYPTLGSSTTSSPRTHRLTRNYSNYSRKGHTRRSAMVFSTNPPRPIRETSIPSRETSDSILNLNDRNFSITPLDNFSTLTKRGTIQETPELAICKGHNVPANSTRRQSEFMHTLSRTPSGIGHGGRFSVSSLSMSSRKRSVGHGQDWTAGNPLSRNSRTWLAVGPTELKGLNHRSQASSKSNKDENQPNNSGVDPTIRQVTLSPPQLGSACISEAGATTRTSRPVSRRVGSSPFFGGASSRVSRKSPKKLRTSYADSPTVPDEATMSDTLGNVVYQELRADDGGTQKYSFGISYGLAREGTRQLRSYMQSRLRRARTRGSIISIESKDSRFESAPDSTMDIQSQRKVETDDGYEDFLPDNCSEGSWETHHTVRDTHRNVIEYSTTNSLQLVTAAARSTAKPSLVPGPTASKSNPNPPMPDIGPNTRMLGGAERRPLSVDGNATKRASRGKIERNMDYTSYI